MEEVGEADILNQYIEVFMNPSSPQEVIGGPFTQPDLRGAGQIEFGLLLFFLLFFLRASARRAP